MFRALFVLLFFGAPLSANPFTAGDLTVDSPVIHKAFAGARTAAGYFEIENSGGNDDALIGIRVEGLHAMLHESRDTDGVVTMVHLDAIEVPAGEIVTFAPGGRHVMIMGLGPGDLAVGETLDTTLIFDRQGEVAITFTVKGLTADGHTHDTSDETN